MEYSVIIHKDEQSGWYTGKCVQVPGAMSQGRTLEELIDNMKDAISLMLECYREEAKQTLKHYEKVLTLSGPRDDAMHPMGGARKC